MDPRIFLEDGFTRWLEEKASGHRVSQSAPLDSFASSARNCGRTAPWLIRLANGSTLNVNDRAQAITDLAGMSLVSRDGQTTELTRLGATVLERWGDLAVANDDAGASPENEIVRSAVLISAALELGIARYAAQYKFWIDLVNLEPAEHWLDGDVWEMYLPSYLNGRDSNGYNPYVVLRALGSGLGSLGEWLEWASQDDAPMYLQRFVNRVSDNRPGGRRNYLKAMEAYRINQFEPATLATTLNAWGI